MTTDRELRIQELRDTISTPDGLRPGWVPQPPVATDAVSAALHLGEDRAGGQVTGNGSGGDGSRWWWSAWDAAGGLLGSNLQGQPLESALGAVEAVEACIGTHPTANGWIS